ncbi:hypothetical protein [Sphingosinicella humi]|uniref:Uncharacterized protein n=1 Tax=Allosphingosinicella humi TaxID=2068657 RepID=A0A2U2J2A6_9SPHN|nr:hypothetical protein [Sphingosinicella humi]PWG02477.1 hypothetical protein DF286_06055 [Sphingosinicella humi]
MRMDYERVDGAGTAKRSLLGILLLPLIAFIAGLAAMGWLLVHWDAAAEFLGIRPAEPPTIAQVTPAPVAPITAPATTTGEPERLVIDPEITRRVVQIEQRIAAIDSQSRQAVGNADRAEGLLVAFAARRALDRGVALGYIEGLLRQRFGDTQRQAVATIITAARQPVTLEDLQEGLQDAGEALTGAGPDQNWWDALKAELSSLVTIRKANTPSTLPAERLRRATRRLEAGQVDVALAEVLRMPGHEHAQSWINDARRYVAARRALDTIETAALLDPRNPPAPPAMPAPAPPPEPVRPEQSE